MRILRLLALLLTLTGASALAQSEGNQLECKINLWQSRRDSKHETLGYNATRLEPRTRYGQKFSSFPLDLQKVGEEAWLHQNLCVGKRDFRQGSFAGTLCVVVMTSRESEENPSVSSLVIDVSRVGKTSLNSVGKLSSVLGDNLGGFSTTVPFDVSGRAVSIIQALPSASTRGDLLKIEISCEA
jgi:hypothetical protein